MNPFVHIAPYSQDQGVSPTEAAWTLSIMGAASASGRVIIGFVTDRCVSSVLMFLLFIPSSTKIFFDRFGSFETMRACIGLMVLTMTCWMFATNFYSIMAFGFVYGFLSGSVPSNLPVIISEVSAFQHPTQPHFPLDSSTGSHFSPSNRIRCLEWSSWPAYQACFGAAMQWAPSVVLQLLDGKTLSLRTLTHTWLF